MQSDDVIKCHALERGYGNIRVLEHVCMTVKRGMIYALLGPSGCGKTTTIRVLLGRLIHSGGECKVLGKTPGEKGSFSPGSNIGYSPQEVALYTELSIEDTFRFHGRLHKLTREQINTRTQELINFLDLPEKHRQVSKLSGGQQRRVSLAVALLHKPQILLLDEPTVGVDPELRYRIWEHIRELTKEGVSIVITTHYIEECIAADMCAFLRHGCIIIEDTPKNILSRTNKPTLEDAFLLICQRDNDKKSTIDLVESSKEKTGEEKPGEDIMEEKETNDSIPDLIDIEKANIQKITPEYYPKGSTSKSIWFNGILDWQHVKAIFIRNISQMLRDRRTLAFVVVIPTLMITLFCTAIGGNPKNLPLHFINDDLGTITNITGFPLPLNLGIGTNLVLNNPPYDEWYEWVYHETREEAITAIQNGNSWGLIHFPFNFTKNLLYTMNQGHLADPRDAQFSIKLDMSNQQLSTKILKDINDAFFTLISGLGFTFSGPSYLEQPVYGSLNPKYIEFLAPGIICLIIFVFSIILTAMITVREKISGALDRVYAADVNGLSIIVGHNLSYSLLLIGQVSVLLMISFLVFELPILGNFIDIVFITFLLGNASMSVGLLISSLAETEFVALQIAMGCFFPIFLLSGIIWYIQGIPIWLRWISYILPTYWSAEAVRSVMIKGLYIDHASVYSAYLINFAAVVIMIFASSIALRRRLK